MKRTVRWRVRERTLRTVRTLEGLDRGLKGSGRADELKGTVGGEVEETQINSGRGEREAVGGLEKSVWKTGQNSQKEDEGLLQIEG